MPSGRIQRARGLRWMGEWEEQAMAGLGRLLKTPQPSGNVPDPADCAHETLTPRWSGPEVMDDDSKAMGFVCHRCHAEFLPYHVRDRRPLAR